MTRIAALLALAVALVGCGDDTPASTADTSPPDTTTSTVAAAPAETTTTSAETTTTVAESSTTTPPTTTTTTGDASAGCLVGDWVISGDSMQTFYDGATAGATGLTITVAGAAHLSFTEDAYQWRPDFTLELTLDAGMGATGTVSGTIDGHYTAVDGRLVTTSEVNAVDTVVTVGGMSVPTDAVNELLDRSPVNGAAFECGTTGPIIHFNTADGTVPVPLDPA